jgi:hypothetical protein
LGFSFQGENSLVGITPLVPDAPLLPSELGQVHPPQEAFISCGVNVFALKTNSIPPIMDQCKNQMEWYLKTKEKTEKSYHLPLACRLGYSSFEEGGDFLRNFQLFLSNIKSPPSLKEGWHEVTGW